MGIDVGLWPLIWIGLAALIAFFSDLWRPLARLALGWGILAGLIGAGLVFKARLAMGEGFYWDSTASILGVYLPLAEALILGFLYPQRANLRYPGAFTGLALTSLLGSLMLVSTRSLPGLFVGLELQVLPFFALLAWPGSGKAALEAAMKYALLAGLAAAFLALGVALIYFGNGSLALNPPFSPLDSDFTSRLGLLLVFAALAFELGIAPFHAWVADIYQGAPLPAILLLGGVSKVAIMGVWINVAGVSANWLQPELVLAVFSVVIGSLLAWRRSTPRRLLGYSATVHGGYFLIALACGPLGLIAATLYALVYGVMHLGSFMGLSPLGDEDCPVPWPRLRRERPILATLLALSLLSLAGMPPTLGFFAKLGVLLVALRSNAWGLAVLLILGSALSFAYYLRPLWQSPASNSPIPLARSPTRSIPAALLILVLGAAWVLLPWLLSSGGSVGS